MRDKDNNHVIEDADGDRLLVADIDEEGERYVAVESEDGDRQAVILNDEQQEELLGILGVGCTFDAAQIKRAAIVQDLIERTLTAGVFGAKSLSTQSAAAVLQLAVFIEGGTSGMAELQAALR